MDDDKEKTKLDMVRSKIFTYCYYILICGIVLDVCLKGIFVDFGANLLFIIPLEKYSIDTITFINAFLLVGIELMILVAAFLTKVFMFAKSGILIWAEKFDKNCFPVKRYLTVSAIIAGAVAVLILLVYIFRSFDPISIAVGALISLAVFAGLFALLLITFYISYLLMRKTSSEKELIV